MIRILQISDIHFHYESPEDDCFSQIRDMFLEDIRHCRENKGEFDCILICGDIAFSGKKEEYSIAKEFIDDLMSFTGAKSVFTVPGNHDVDRDRYADYKKVIRKHFINSATEFVKKRYKEPIVLKPLYIPLTEYYCFVKDYHPISDVATKFILEDKNALEMKDQLYWMQEIKRENDYLFRLVGINTCLISDSDDEKKHPQAIPSQMWNVRRKNNEINILLAHHPLSCVKYGTTIQNRIDTLFHVQFYGHQHKQSTNAKDSIKIYSGALQPPEMLKNAEDYKPIYNVIELAISNNQLEAKIESRQWDGSLFSKFENCIQSLKVPVLAQDSWTDITPSASTVSDVYQLNQTPDMQETATKIYSLSQLFITQPLGIQMKVIKDVYPTWEHSFNRASVQVFLRRIRREGKEQPFTEACAKYLPTKE